MLLEAVALLRARGRAVTCRVIGDGPLRAGLAAQAERLGIGDAVEFRSDVHDRHDLYSLVKSGRVFAFPSEREGFGIAVLEALACGLPVVTTSAPDNLAAALVERSGRGLICAPSAAALADAVERVLLGGDRPPGAEHDDGWLADHDWDAVSERVRQAVLP
jgi:glycosyltransferase involved in cell wall biosynthesis